MISSEVLKIGHPQHPPLIFLHGFMGQGDDWLPIATHFAPPFYCLLPDLPGHGQHLNLPLTTPLDFQTLAQAFIQWLDELNLATIALVGYSMGGRLALYLATHYPHRIKYLIVESANPGVSNEEDRKKRAKVDDERANLLCTTPLKDFLEQWYAMPLFQSLQQYPHRLNHLKQKRSRNNPQYLAKVIAALSPGRQLPLWTALPTLTMPVLLLAGGLDKKYTTLMTKMNALIPQSTLKIMPQAGHTIHLEQPLWFTQQLQNFLFVNS